MKEDNVAVFVEYRHPFNTARIYLHSYEYYYTFVEGKIVENKMPQDCGAGDDSFFIEVPIWIANVLAKGLSMWLSSNGGIVPEQFNKGKIERFENETEWLRGLVEKQMK